MEEMEILESELNQLYSELKATFTDKEQHRLLKEIVETEIELEGLCNQ